MIDEPLRFTRLSLTNWRNFAKADVDLQSRAFFVGANASGKSNLLDALRFLRDLSKPGGGLGAAITDRGGMSSVRCLHARAQNSIEIGVGIGTDSDPDRWTYDLKFNQKKGDAAPKVEEEKVRAGHGVVLDRTSKSDRDDPDLLTQTHLEQLSQNKPFRVVSDFFRSIRYLHVVPQIVRDARRGLDESDDPYGGDLLIRIKETEKAHRLEVLRIIGQALSIAVPQFKGLDLVLDSAGRPHLRAGFVHWRSGSAGQNERSFSDGTLRLIGFLWSISEPGGPLLLEEPELSLNDAIARAIPGMIAMMQSHSRRQVLMTTHSTALLNDEGVGLDEAHLLQATESGTTIVTAVDESSVNAQVHAGSPLGDALLPKATTASVNELASFDVAAR